VSASSRGSAGTGSSSEGDTSSTSRPVSISRYSRSFPGFAEPIKKRWRSGGSAVTSRVIESRTLRRDEPGDAVHREGEDAIEVRPGEGPALGGPLDLDELALARRDDVHVRVGDRVLGVREVEHELALHVTRGYRRDAPDDPRGVDLAHRVGQC